MIRVFLLDVLLVTKLEKFPRDQFFAGKIELPYEKQGLFGFELSFISLSKFSLFPKVRMTAVTNFVWSVGEQPFAASSTAC